MNQHSQKSPVLGGILAIIPGLGHLYAGRGVDGLRSFLINAAGIGLTVFCFVMGMPVFGVLFGVIEAALYLSNVYGGVNAVMQQNARFIVERRDELLKILAVPPLDVITLREELYGP
jgi:TM2 domain-containing membrane protein YozV